MTQPDPRQQVRDLIAAKLCDKADYCTECAVQADAVMELFPEVDLVREYHGPGYEIPIGRGSGYVGDVSTHTRYLLHTAPESIEEKAMTEIRRTDSTGGTR